MDGDGYRNLCEFRKKRKRERLELNFSITLPSSPIWNKTFYILFIFQFIYNAHVLATLYLSILFIRDVPFRSFTRFKWFTNILPYGSSLWLIALGVDVFICMVLKGMVFVFQLQNHPVRKYIVRILYSIAWMWHKNIKIFYRTHK